MYKVGDIVEKLRLLVVDEKMRTAEILIEPWIFRQLGITADIVKTHKSKSALNTEITKFLNSPIPDIDKLKF